MGDPILDEAANASPIYYRVLLAYDEPLFVAATLQWFDERDIDEARFLSGPLDTAGEARGRAAYANRLIPPHLRTVETIALLKRASEVRPLPLFRRGYPDGKGSTGRLLAA